MGSNSSSSIHHHSSLDQLKRPSYSDHYHYIILLRSALCHAAHTHHATFVFTTLIARARSAPGKSVGWTYAYTLRNHHQHCLLLPLHYLRARTAAARACWFPACNTRHR